MKTVWKEVKSNNFEDFEDRRNKVLGAVRAALRLFLDFRLSIDFLVREEGAIRRLF